MISNARFKDFIKIPKNYRPEDGVFIKYDNKLISAVRDSEKQTSGAIQIIADTELGQDFIDLFDEKYIYVGLLINRVASGSKMELELNSNDIIEKISSNKGEIIPEKHKGQYDEIIKEYNKYFSFNENDLLLSLNGNKMVQAFIDDNCFNLADYYDELVDISLPILMVSDKLLSSVYPMIKKNKIIESFINIYNHKSSECVKIVEYKFIIENFIVLESHAVITKGGE